VTRQKLSLVPKRLRKFRSWISALVPTGRRVHCRRLRRRPYKGSRCGHRDEPRGRAHPEPRRPLVTDAEFEIVEDSSDTHDETLAADPAPATTPPAAELTGDALLSAALAPDQTAGTQKGEAIAAANKTTEAEPGAAVMADTENLTPAADLAPATALPAETPVALDDVSIHAQCVRLADLSITWDQSSLAIAIDRVIKAGLKAPDAPNPISADATKDLVLSLAGWVQRLGGGKLETEVPEPAAPTPKWVRKPRTAVQNAARKPRTEAQKAARRTGRPVGRPAKTEPTPEPVEIPADEPVH
jgi:hypothetical protein